MYKKFFIFVIFVIVGIFPILGFNNWKNYSQSIIVPPYENESLPAPKPTPTPTQNPLLAEDFNLTIEKLVKDKIIGTKDGELKKLNDFNEAWAQLNWYQWYPTDYSPRNFVIRMNIEYSSASKTANWQQSGCGIVFRGSTDDKKNLHQLRAFYALDGNTYIDGVDGLIKWWDGKIYPKDISVGKGYYGRPTIPDGKAAFMVVAYGDRFTNFVNGKKIATGVYKEVKEGFLAMTLASGTNKDFGTRCKMTGIELFILPNTP